MKKWLALGIALVFIFVAWLGILYLNKVFLPQKIKFILTKNLSEQLGRQVQLDSLRYALFKGIIIENLRISDAEQKATKPLLEVRKLHFNVFFAPFAKAKVIIPTLYLDSPTLNLKYKGDKTTNIPLVQLDPKSAGGFLVSGIIVTNGRLFLEDQTQAPYFVREVQDLNVQVGLALPQDLKVSLQGEVVNGDNSKTAFSIKGKLDLARKDLIADIQMKDLSLGEYGPYLTNLPVSQLNGKVRDSQIQVVKHADEVTADFTLALERISFVKDNLKVSGSIAAKGNIDYGVRDKKTDYHCSINIAAGEIKGMSLPAPIGVSSGVLELRKENIGWQDLVLKYEGRQFKLTGQMNNFVQPVIETAVWGQDLSAKTRFLVQDKALSIIYLDGNYLNSKFNLQGNLDFKDTAGPTAELKGLVSFDLKDVVKIAGESAQNLIPQDFSGILQTNISLKGPLFDARSLRIALASQSSALTLTRLKFTNVSLNYNQLDSEGKLRLSAQLYKGSLDLSSELNLADPDISYTALLSLKDIDLSLLKEDTAWKDKNTSGKLNVSASLAGRGRDTSRLEGTANLAMSAGNLLEVNVLKDLGKVLFPGTSDKIVFNMASGDFEIAESKVSTRNLKFSSDEVEFTLEGNFDFQGNLNFNAMLRPTSVSEKKQAESIGDMVASILGEVQKYIVVKVTGTFQEPKYKVVPQSESLFKDLINSFQKQ